MTATTSGTTDRYLRCWLQCELLLLIDVTAFKFHYQWSLNYIYFENKIKTSRKRLWGFVTYTVQKFSLFKKTAFSHRVLFKKVCKAQQGGDRQRQSNIEMGHLNNKLCPLGHSNPLIKTLYIQTSEKIHKLLWPMKVWNC